MRGEHGMRGESRTGSRRSDNRASPLSRAEVSEGGADRGDNTWLFHANDESVDSPEDTPT